MDPLNVSQPAEEQDWDADDFEIPTLIPEKSREREETKIVKKDTFAKEKTEVNTIYLGPHGAPPSQLKQQQPNTPTGKKNKRKQKLKEADKKGFTTGRENKVDSLRDLMGNKGNYQTAEGNRSDWLDPHCHENIFERGGR